MKRQVYQKIWVGVGCFVFLSSALCEGAIKEEAIRFRIRGYQLQHQGELDEAVAFYKQAIVADPNYAAPHNDLGVIYEEKGELQEAEGAYLQAVALDPSYVDAYSNLAILYEKTGQKEKMLQALQKRIAMGKPADVGTQEARKKLESLEGVSPPLEVSPISVSPPKTVSSLEETPDATFLRNEGLKLQRKGELDEAIRYYRAALRKDPQFVSAYNDLGIVLEEKGFLESAEGAYQKALSLKASYKHALYNLGFLYIKMGKTREAINALEQFVQGEGEEGERLQEARAKLALLKVEEEWKEEKLQKSEYRRRRIEEAKERHERKRQLTELAELQALKAREEKARRLEEARKEREIQELKRRKEAKEKLKRLRIVKAEETVEKKKAKETALAEKKRIEEEKRKKEEATLYEEAKGLYREGHLEKAERRFEKVLLLSPEHPYAGRYIERIHEKQKEEEEAKKAKEAEAKAKEVEERARRAAAKEAERKHQELQKSQKALARQKEAKKLAKLKEKETRMKAIDRKTKQLAQAYYEEGRRVFRRGEIDKAIYAYEKALFLNKDHEKAKRELLAAKEKEEAEAWRAGQEETYRKEYTDLEERRLYERAKAAYDAKNYELARETLEYLLVLNPMHPFAQEDLAEVEEKIREKRQEEALARAMLKKEAEKGLETPPKVVAEKAFIRAQQPLQTPRAPYLPSEKGILKWRDKEAAKRSSMEKIAWAYEQKGFDLQDQDREKALTSYQKAMAIRPSSGAANGLGVLYERKGWYVQAEEAYKEAIALDPAYLAAHTNLALLYERLERKEEAVRHWKIRAEKGEPGDFWTQKAQHHLQGMVPKKNP